MQLIDPELQGGDAVRSTFDRNAMDSMFPLHMLLSYDGSILAIGRTLEKLTSGQELIKAAFFDFFTVAKPGGIDSIEMLLAKSNTKLRIRANWDHALELRGMAVPAGPNVMLPLALGTKLAAMVDQYGLKVQDFSPADNSVELIYMIETQSAIINDSKQVNDSLMKAKVEAERLAMTDSLTGLPNRRALIAELEARLKRPDAHGGRFALLHLDLDKFKMVNDTLGHAAGDQVLTHAAAVFSSAVRDQDLIARIGGDEFVIVLHQNPAPDLVHSIGTQIIDRIAAPIPYREQYCQIGASIGVAFFDPDNPVSPEKLLRDADLALYESKHNGRGRLKVFTPAMRRAFEKVDRLSSDIASALKRDRFVPFFQPQLDVRTGEICGFEALARWRHPQQGILSPKEFLYVADQAGLLGLIDDMILTKAVSALSTWRRAGFGVPKVSVNVTASRLEDGELTDKLNWACDAVDIDPEGIAIEILESVLLDSDESRVPEQVRHLRNAGYRIDLDDFGTGHAALANLTRFKVDVVKIDRSFVAGLVPGSAQHRITSSIVSLLNDLGIKPLAEGVETDGDIETLYGMGCHLMQGYAIARPMSEEDAMVWMEERAQTATNLARLQG